VTAPLREEEIMRRVVPLIVAMAALGLLLSSSVFAHGREVAAEPARASTSWIVTISNLTPPGSQPLSAPLFVVHSDRVDVWSVGDIATHVVAAIAEDANNAPAESALRRLRGVSEVFTGEGDAIPPGESRTYRVTTQRLFNQLTVLTMLVNTNDAFTGLDGVFLSGPGVAVRTMAYDAGSEINNELTAFIPGPCCNNPFIRDPEGRLIRPHRGILGVGDLDPSIYGWKDPVAMIVVERSGPTA
jgi:hypothetical protein